MDMKEGEQMNRGNDQRAILMEANNLSYKFDDILNVSVNRTMKKQYFDTRTYQLPGAGQAVSTWNGGVDLIDLMNSNLGFRVRLDGGTADDVYTFGSGSAMNLIREIKILSSSGIELARTQDANIFHKFYAKSVHSSNWFNTVGKNMGFGMTDELKIDEANGVYFTIPLRELDPFFNLYDGKLLPANLASGLRVEITWEDQLVAFFTGGAADLENCIIDQIEFRTECVTLADSAMAQLNREASNSGLEVTIDRIYTTSKNTGTLTSENVEVRKAVSLAKSAFAVCLPALRNGYAVDSFNTSIHQFTSYDFRLGNQYYPYQPIENTSQGYFNYLKCFNKIKHSHNETVITPAVYNASNAIICASFENDDSLNLSGLSINSSRIMEVRFERGVPGPPAVIADVKTYVFLTYTALIRASLSNASVKI